MKKLKKLQRTRLYFSSWFALQGKKWKVTMLTIFLTSRLKRWNQYVRLLCIITLYFYIYLLCSYEWACVTDQTHLMKYLCSSSCEFLWTNCLRNCGYSVHLFYDMELYFNNEPGLHIHILWWTALRESTNTDHQQILCR